MWVVLGIGMAARLALALTHHGVIYPDETYQMSEAAHRVVFGYGIVPWEFQQGLRSWIGPGALLPPTALARWLGADGLHLMLLVKGWVALWSCAGLVATAVAARRLAGPGAGLLAAGLAALSPLSLAYDVHPLADTAAAPLPVLAVALLTGRDTARRVDVRALLAGVALVAAFALRPQLLPLVLGFAVATVVSRSRARTIGLALGFAAGALLSGILDALTWGLPFAPEWRSATFNVIQNGANLWGREPAGFYLSTSYRALGPIGLALLACGLLLAVLPRRNGIERLPTWPLVAGVALLLAVLTSIGHKELRFLIATLPLLEALSAVGLARALQRLPAAPGRPVAPGRGPAMAEVACACLAVVSLAVGGWHAQGLTMGDLGYTGDVRSAWGADEATPRLLSVAGSSPGTCGVVVLTQRLTWSGGYSYLHEDVPLSSAFHTTQAGDWRAWANVLVTGARSALPPGYRAVARYGPEVLARRPGPCALPPPAVLARHIAASGSP